MQIKSRQSYTIFDKVPTNMQHDNNFCNFWQIISFVRHFFDNNLFTSSRHRNMKITWLKQMYTQYQTKSNQLEFSYDSHQTFNKYYHFMQLEFSTISWKASDKNSTIEIWKWNMTCRLLWFSSVFNKLLTDTFNKYFNAPLTVGVMFCNFKKYFTWEIEVTL